MDLESFFLRAASAPVNGSHSSGSLDEAEAALRAHPEVRVASVYTAAVLGDAAAIERMLAEDANLSSTKGGPCGWDALTYLCFSRYLRLDRERSDGFIRSARLLLEAGANPNTGWYEEIDHPNPRWVLESAIYGAAGLAQHAGVTRVLLEYGADPNDEETPYHVAEGYDLETLTVLLESGRLNAKSLEWLAVRKADWHDLDGVRLVLRYGADANAGLRQAIKRDNGLVIVREFLDAGASEDRSLVAMAAARGRKDVLLLFKEQGWTLELDGVDALILKCALGDPIGSASAELLERGGALLAEFAGNGNVDGIAALLAAGVKADELYGGDRYYDIAPDSTALHVAAWRARPETLAVLLRAGTPVNARDGEGRTALQLAVKACVDSYWTSRQSPESVKLLLESDASVDGVMTPCGYEPVDALLGATGL